MIHPVYAYLMALLEINEQNEIMVRHFVITSSEHLACQLQKQTYACVERYSGDTFAEACEILKNSIHSRMFLSRPGSLWHAIHNQISREKTQM